MTLRVLVIGHTDAVGPAAYNRQLSTERADAVREALATYGIASSRIRADGRGEVEPRADNDTVDGRQANRRVEIMVTPARTPTLQAGLPFLVQGPFAAPSVRFNLNGTLSSAVGSPADLARARPISPRTRRPSGPCATSSTCSTSCPRPPPAERATSSRACSAAGEVAPSAPRARVHPALRTGRGDCSKALAASGQAQTEAILRDAPGTQAAQAEITT